MTTARRLWIGFGSLTLLLALSVLLIAVRLATINQSADEAAQAWTLGVIGRNLRFSLGEYASAVKERVLFPAGTGVADTAELADGVERTIDDYEKLAIPDDQKEPLTRLETSWRELRAAGEDLAQSEGPIGAERLTSFNALRDQTVAVAAEIQQSGMAAFTDTRGGARAGIRRVFGLTLLVLVAGVAMALVTSVATARGIMRDRRLLAEEGEKFRTTLASVGDAVITTDLQGTVSSLNPVAESLTAWSQAHARGRPLQEIFHIVNEDTRASVENPVFRALREGLIMGLANHTILIAKDGTERPIDDSAAPILNAEGEVTGAVLVFRDVTESRRVERELREANRRKSEFLAMLAHELRNPLAPICAGIDLIPIVAGDPAKLEQVRRTMQRQAQQLRVLVDDLVDVSRITRGRLELRSTRVRLSEVIETALEASSPAIEEAGHRLTVEIPEEPVHLEADPHRLAQVVSNLLNNAAKYTPPGGRIWLRATSRGSELTLTVTDTGIGIPPERQQGVFEMFAQGEGLLERSGSGLGIGLTLVRTLVEMHGGKVEVSSAGENQGSEFRLTVPVVEAAPGQGPEDQPRTQQVTAKTRLRMVVADDNEAAANMLAMLLANLGHEVRTAADGEEAVSIVESFRPRVVLMDLGMPRMNGYEAVRHIREQPWGKKIVVLALTGWGQDDDRRLTEEAGFDGHLVKPADLADIQKLMEGVEAEA